MTPIEQAREALKDVLSSLVAAHSLLSRSPKTAAPSNKMFDTMLSDYAKSIKRGRKALASLPPANPEAEARLRERVEELEGLVRWAHDTLYEINPSNYDHDEVCKLNNASVEVILGLAPTLGEKHGKTDAWWEARLAQAEGGPAVTGAQREAFCRELAMLQYEGGFRDRDVEPYADRLLAALHSQSAAGEEGKP